MEDEHPEQCDEAGSGSSSKAGLNSMNFPMGLWGSSCLVLPLSQLLKVDCLLLWAQEQLQHPKWEIPPAGHGFNLEMLLSFAADIFQLNLLNQLNPKHQYGLLRSISSTPQCFFRASNILGHHRLGTDFKLLLSPLLLCSVLLTHSNRAISKQTD